MKPTYLYVKQHAITKLKYFGKTNRKNVLNYLGSGTYWANHIRTHGIEHVKTLWYELFTEEADLVEFATFFSEFHNIVESKEWANLKIEDGLGGGWIGPRTQEHKDLQSRIQKGRPGRIQFAEEKIKRSKSMMGHVSNTTDMHWSWSDAAKETNSKSQLALPKLKCKHCDTVGKMPGMNRWHNDNCKFKVEQ